MHRMIQRMFGMIAVGLMLGPWALAQQAPAKTVVRVGHFSNITHAQVLIGRANHWFEEDLAESASVEWKIFNAGPSAVESLFAGQLDLVYIGPSPAVNAYVKSDGEAVRVVAGSASGGAALVVRPEAGIQKPDDFRGKKIASPQIGNTQDVALRSWLGRQGLKLKEVGGDVQVLPMAGADQVALFLKKELDAAWAVEPWVSLLTQKAGGKILFYESSLWENGRYATTVVLARKKFLEEHPELVKQFLKTHVRITEWIGSHPEEAKRLVQQEIERQTGRPFERDVLEQAWPQVEFSAEILSGSIQTQAQAAYRAGFLRKEPDLNHLFDTSFLEACPTPQGSEGICVLHPGIKDDRLNP